MLQYGLFEQHSHKHSAHGKNCVCACLPACFVLLAYSPGLTRFYLQEVQADWVSCEPCFPWPPAAAGPHIRFGDVRNGQQQGSTQAPIMPTVCDHANELSKRFKRQTLPVIRMTIQHINVTAERSDKNSLIFIFCCFSIDITVLVCFLLVSAVFYIKSPCTYIHPRCLYIYCSSIKQKVFPWPPEWLQIDSAASPEGWG